MAREWLAANGPKVAYIPQGNEMVSIRIAYLEIL